MYSTFASRVVLEGSAALKGKSSKLAGSDKAVHEFLGIPYAQPPVGELRFKPPKPAQLWDGVRQADQFGPICHQHQETEASMEAFPIKSPEGTRSEDCLYLNVYTPILEQDAKLPVMFWIHGGAFVIGYSDLFQGHALCSFHDAVVVSINYRVGALGFLCMNDDELPGNYGLLDQIEALKWVQMYIGKFGGDPTNVTIFGESAGAISCSMLMLSDLTEGLFKRAICESGSALYPGSKSEKAYESLKTILEGKGCDVSSKENMREFLKKMSGEDINQLDGEGTFHPVTDGHVLQDEPYNLLQKGSGQYLKTDLLLGCNSHEGWMTLMEMAMMMELDPENLTYADAEGIMEALSAYITLPDDLMPKLMDYYLPKKEQTPSDELAKSLCDLFGDLTVAHAVDQEAMRHSEGAARTYLYHFAYRPSWSSTPPWVITDHGPELFYVFGYPFHAGLCTAEFTKEETELSRVMMNHWVQFATNGNSTSEGSIKWLQYTKEKEECLSICGVEPTVEKWPHAARMQVWRENMYVS